MMANPKMIEWLFSKHESELKFLPDYVFENREVVKKMVSVNGSLLQLIPKFNADREIVMAAIKSNNYAAKFMDKSLSEDPDIAKMLPKAT